MGPFGYNIVASMFINTISLFFLLYLIVTNTSLSKKKMTLFVLAVSSTIICYICEVVSFIAEEYGPQYRIMNYISVVIAFIFSPSICLLLSTLYEEKIYNKLKILFIPFYINIVLVLTNPLTNWMFSISEDNVYTRGPLYWIYIMIYVYSLFVLMYSNLLQSRKYFLKEKIFIFVLYILLIGGTATQVFFLNIHTSWHTITLALIFYYLLLREIKFRYDPLTTTLNRAAFEDAMKRLKPSDNTYIVFFDINDFKKINDTYGHVAGDKYLKISADNIKHCFESIGNVYRIGGDEFCIIATPTTKGAIEELLNKMEERIDVQRIEDPIIPTISYGYSICNKESMQDADNFDFLKDADTLMYFNKKNSKD